MSTQKCILVKRGSKGQCVCASRISKAEADALGIDWDKIPSFAELCKKAGIEKIIVGSTETTASKILAKYKKRQIGGLDMPEYKYPLIEGVDDFEDIEGCPSCMGGTEVFEEESGLSGELGQIVESIKEFVPSMDELTALGKAVAGSGGSFALNKYVIDKYISPERWVIRSITKLLSSYVGGKLISKHVDSAVAIGFVMYGLIDAIQTAYNGYRVSKAVEETLQPPQPQPQPEVTAEEEETVPEEGGEEVGFIRSKEYLLGTEVYESGEEFGDYILALTPEEEGL